MGKKIYSGDASDWHGFDKPAGLTGEGHEGTGPGHQFGTRDKPLPVGRGCRVTHRDLSLVTVGDVALQMSPSTPISTLDDPPLP